MSTSHLTKLKRKATEFEQKKQFDKALSLYIQFVDEAGRDLDDADLQLFNRVGDLLTRQGNVTEALAYYEKAVDMYAERGFLNNAIALCNKILRQSPARSVVYYKLGRISASKGFRSDARKNFLEYADRMQKAGQRDEAFRALKEFVDLCPDQDDIRLMLADMLSKDSRSTEAIEQLQQVWERQQAEGRESEARATADRIKAIDPEASPRSTGTFAAVRSNDLVFLDLTDAPVAAPRATPRAQTPVAPVAAVETVDVSAVGALSGLAITFLPGENDPLPSFSDRTATPVDGLLLPEVVEADREVAPASLDLDATAVPSTADGQQVEAAIDLDALPDPVWDSPDSVVPHIEGLSSAAVTLTGANPILEPLLDDPPLSGLEFGGIELESHDLPVVASDHDLALPTTLPLLDDLLQPAAESMPLIEVTPDAWVDAALGAPRDDFRLDHLLTPLENRAIPEVVLAAPAVEALPSDDLGAAGAAEEQGALETEPEAAGAERASLPEEAPEIARIVTAEHPVVATSDEVPPTVEMREPAPEPAAERQDTPVAEAGASDEPPAAGSPEETNHGLQLGDETPPAFRALDEGAREDEPPAADDGTASGVLDVQGLRASLTGGSAADIAAVREDAMLRAAFEEQRVELPLLDLENSVTPTPPTFGAISPELEELLSAPASFNDDGVTGFEPQPLDLDAPAQPPEEWPQPEVLIDGEWRDEHVGDLVSGEIHVVGHRRPVQPPAEPPAVFDDLAAAMLYAPTQPDPRRTPHTRGPGDFLVQPTPRTSLSFGGLEVQLRRRLELTPQDTGLRYQLAEALLDAGDREAGLNELETVVQMHEAAGKLDDACSVVDVILRVVPLSVRHHQKRVEYAARAGNRPRLVEAYTELGDALFRCGEPEKAAVVYSRVLELAPGNERARFALAMLSQDGGLPRQSDEIPLIEAGVLGGAPSYEIANLTPDLLDAVGAATAAPEPVDKPSDEVLALDAEVDAAFEAPLPPPKPRPTPSPAVAAHEGESFVDLGDWLRADDAPRSTRMVAGDVTPTGDEAADFATLLQRFKAGVEQNVEADDYASHYDLGVAFKEMGLVDEAIGQFQRALQGVSHRIRAYEALGQCFVEKGQYQVAWRLLQRVADQPDGDELTLLGVLYLCGFACEQVGRTEDALRYYQRVFAVDIGFRDVSARLAALENPSK